jgi:type IV pilus biogenesis protein PilP
MKIKSLLAMLSLMPVIAYAVTTSTDQGASVSANAPQRATVPDELAELQSQVPLWKARAEIAKYKADVRNAETSPSAGPSASLGAPLPQAQPTAVTVPMHNPAPSADANSIRVVSIRAYKGQYAAALDIGGNIVNTQPGDVIEGDWLVSSISDTQVQLSKKGLTRVVRF